MAVTQYLADIWPELPYQDWDATCETLHLWTQIAGKVIIASSPLINHWWNSVFYVSARGLTSALLYQGQQRFTLEFDFVDHQFYVRTSAGLTETIPLEPQSVAQFYAALQDCLARLGLHIPINTMPCEIEGAIRFEDDIVHSSYERTSVEKFWRILVLSHRVMQQFRSQFLGKSSPVHFFWGSFDLAVTRFSGRSAPPPTGKTPHVASWVMAEAYSHEVSSCGFWPGNGGYGKAAFYAYAYPEPPGYGAEPLKVADAYYDLSLGQYLLAYDSIRERPDRDAVLLKFFQDCYDRAAQMGHWDRAALVR